MEARMCPCADRWMQWSQWPHPDHAEQLPMRERTRVLGKFLCFPRRPRTLIITYDGCQLTAIATFSNLAVARLRDYLVNRWLREEAHRRWPNELGIGSLHIMLSIWTAKFDDAFHWLVDDPFRRSCCTCGREFSCAYGSARSCFECADCEQENWF